MISVLSPVAQAKEAARLLHRDQKYGVFPYMSHLEDVVCLLLSLDFNDPDLLTAAWLHDSVEDTAMTLDRIEAGWNSKVRVIVDALTNNNDPHAIINRQHRQAWTEHKIKVLLENPIDLSLGLQALTIKLADRVSNVEACWRDRNTLLFRYHKEYPNFRKLRDPSQDPRILGLWDRLDKLFGWRDA